MLGVGNIWREVLPGRMGKTDQTVRHFRNILTEADLLKLQESGEMILISPYGWNRIQKVPYFKDKYFKKKADVIQENNDAYIGRFTNDVYRCD